MKNFQLFFAYLIKWGGLTASIVSTLGIPFVVFLAGIGGDPGNIPIFVLLISAICGIVLFWIGGRWVVKLNLKNI